MADVLSAQAARPIAAASTQQARRLELAEVLRLGSAFGGDDEFGRIMDVKLGREGRVYVADDRKHQITVFDSTGRLLHRTGRRGQGPGEFEAPWNVAVDARDSVFVWDWMLGRVSVFSPDLRFTRSFAAPARWILTGLEIGPDGNLLVGSYVPEGAGTVHVFSRAGRLIRTFGPQPPRGAIPEPAARNLLGGSIDLDGSTVVYSNKSPYDLRFLGTDGRPQARCTGEPRWTTPPDAVLFFQDGEEGVDWPAYVHSGRVVALGGGVFLNQVVNHRQRQVTLDLLSSGCELLERRTVRDTNRIVKDRRGNRLVAIEEREYPEVIVYRYRVVPGR